MFCPLTRNPVSRSAREPIATPNSPRSPRRKAEAPPEDFPKTRGSRSSTCSSSSVTLNALDRRQVAMLLATRIIHHPDVGPRLVHETRVPILGEDTRIVDGDDVLELLAAIDLADAFDGAQLVGVGRARIVEERSFVEPCRLDDQGIAVPMAGRVAGIERKGFELIRRWQRLGHRDQANDMVELVEDMDFPTVGTFYDLERIGAFKNPRYAVRRAELAGLVVERIGFHRRHVLDVVGSCRRRVWRIPAP